MLGANQQFCLAGWKKSSRFAFEKRKIMLTTATRKLQSTPMAPYMEIIKNMDLNDLHIVVEFLNEAIREAEEAKRKAEDEFLAKKMAEIEVSPRIKKLIEDTRLTPEEAEDERTRYILGLDFSRQ